MNGLLKIMTEILSVKVFSVFTSQLLINFVLCSI